MPRVSSAVTSVSPDPPNASVSVGRRPLPCCVSRTYTFYFRTTVSTRQQMAARTDASCAYVSPYLRRSLAHYPRYRAINEQWRGPRESRIYRGSLGGRGNAFAAATAARSLASPLARSLRRVNDVDVKATRAYAARPAFCVARDASR